MPPRPGGAPPAVLSSEDVQQLIVQMAQSSQRLADAVAGLTGSQASFMRSVADADVNIGLSKSHPLIHSELLAAQAIDNTVDNDHRNGMLASERDTLSLPHDDYVSDLRSADCDPTDVRHATASTTYGLGHVDATPERHDSMNAVHRQRGRNIRTLEKQLPAGGYMNTFTTPELQQRQWEAHPLTLTGSLAEGDVRKGEYTMPRFIEQHRWYTEHGKAYNSKQFIPEPSELPIGIPSALRRGSRLGPRCL